MSSPAVAVSRLDVRLRPVANRIRMVGFRLIKTMTKLTGHMLSAADVEHLTLTAAFEAYLELGGDPDRPDRFDFTGRALELEKAGLRWLKRETLGRNTEFGDIATRLSSRKTTAFVDAYRWSAWTHAAFERQKDTKVSGGTNNNVTALEYVQPTEQEAALMDVPLDGLLTDLRAVLDAQSFQWLVERFRDGVTQAEQVAALVASTPKYQDATGAKRAEDYINQKVCRARKRAATLLAEKWAGVAREVGA